jgi:hypothetical protein
MSGWRKKPAYIQRQRASAREAKEREQYEGYVAAIDRLTNQLKVEQDQNQIDDDKRALREKVTIGLLVATVLVTGIADGIFYLTMQDAHENAQQQVGKMEEASKLVRDSNGINRQSMEASTRAWVGPSDANIVGGVQVAKPVTVNISISNSGREPAKSFSITPDPVAIVEDDAAFEMDMDNFVTNCFATPARTDAQVLYPSSGIGSGYQDQVSFGADKITPEVVSGNAILVVRGCITYQTFSQTRHSSFCYFYKGGVTKSDHLSICFKGSSAN